ncbi:MAG: patatin-like phospholipase family protein [Thermoplasmata archaeon]
MTLNSYKVLASNKNYQILHMMKSVKKIRNIVMSGGGFYGYAEVGVLKELFDSYREYFDIQNIVGVSVGSMVAALFAVGYDPDELVKIMFNLDFDKLIRDTHFAYIRLYEKYGMYEAEKLEEEMEKLIRTKTNIKYCTFSQIEKNLTIISTNLNMQCARFFDKKSSPEFPISKAIRMSIGYPLIITPVLFEGDLYGDGGEFMNYPINLFKDRLDETIGITFSAYNENNDGTLKTKIPINNIFDYIRSIGLTLSRAAYVAQITKEELERSIIVHIDKQINSMQFNLTDEQKKYIYSCGISATKEQARKILGIEKVAISYANLAPHIFQENISDSSHNYTKIFDNAVRHVIDHNPELIENLNIVK